jgi:hypothetical protein
VTGNISGVGCLTADRAVGELESWRGRECNIDIGIEGANRLVDRNVLPLTCMRKLETKLLKCKSPAATFTILGAVPRLMNMRSSAVKCERFDTWGNRTT